MKKKPLSQKRKGEIAHALLWGLPAPTKKEMRAVAEKNGMSFSEVKKLTEKVHKPTKLKRAS